jgi:hypothetical protein
MSFKADLKSGVVATLVLAAAIVPFASAHANGWLEDRPWQFETTTDQANKAAVTDLIEKKKGGYYDSFQTKQIYNTTNTNTTNIDHQVNCSVTAVATGNSGTNSMVASASSPVVTNTSNTTATTTGNNASNGIGTSGPSGVVLSTTDPNNPNNINNGQTNSGTLSSGVDHSSTHSSSGTINAGGGTTHQALNSTQTNTAPQTATVTGSTACSLTSGTPLN